MVATIALYLCFAFILLVFIWESRRQADVTYAILVPIVWYSISASRPLSIWLDIIGVVSASGNYTEQATLDGYFYAFMTALGMIILLRRDRNWSEFLTKNIWISMLFALMMLSVLWSEYPFVSAKRLIKSFGALVMALVVLTEPRPLEALLAVLRRSAYILIPLSIVIIQYFRVIGLAWNWEGTAVSWIGVAASKNMLGQLAVVSAICFLWNLQQHAPFTRERAVDYLYLAMSIYLLKGSDAAISMTSVSVFILSILILWGLRSKDQSYGAAKANLTLFFLAIISLLGVIIWHSIAPFASTSTMGSFIIAMGRDLTLTGRTEIWSDVYDVASNQPISGVGYGAFWIGRLANIPWTENLTWTLGQAHNGYIDLYLQLGWIGVLILAAMIFSVHNRLSRSLSIEYSFTRLRATFFLMILFVNITESTFLRGDHSLWFLFLTCALFVKGSNEIPKKKTIQEDEKKSTENQHKEWKYGGIDIFTNKREQI